MPGNEYKAIDNEMLRQVKSDLEQNLDRFRDPIVLGELVFRMMEERENTNRILKNILQKLEVLETKLAETPHPAIEAQLEQILPEVDEHIMMFVRENGKATAEDIRAKFNYKGKNAASARLNRLCDMNLLKKMQVGKKVFFLPY